MAELKTVLNSGGLWAGSLDNVVIGIWAGRATMEQIRVAANNHRALARAFPAGVFSLGIMPMQKNHAPLEAEERKYLQGVMKELGPQTISIANVIEGSGLMTSAIRALVNGFGLFSKSPMRTFAEPAPATEWFASSGKLGVSSSELVKAVEEARRQWREAWPRP